jgi:beta-glucanase (GH16 family)
LRKLTVILALLGAAFFLLPGAAMAGVSGPAFYVDGQAYRTVGTPTDFATTGAPSHSFDTIYAIPGQMNVGSAAPGDRDYNGGRWKVHGITVIDFDVADADNNGVLDSAEEVEAAIANGSLVDEGVIDSFECPVIKLPAKQR